MPELSITWVAYPSFADMGSWEDIRACACAVVKGGSAGLASRRDN